MAEKSCFKPSDEIITQNPQEDFPGDGFESILGVLDIAGYSLESEGTEIDSEKSKKSSD